MVARGIDNNREAFDGIDTQAKQIEANYSELKSHEKRTAGIVLVVIALVGTIAVTGGVGVLTGLPMVSDLAGYILLGVGGAGGVTVASGVLLLEQSHLSKLRGLQKDALGTEIGYLELAQAMSVDAVTTEVVSAKIAEYSAEEFDQFFAIINQAVEDEGISDHDAKFVDAFAQNAAKFTDAQIQDMNPELAARIHASALRPPEEGRFGMLKIVSDMARDLDAGQIANSLADFTSEKLVEFVQLLDSIQIGFSLPEKFVDALAQKAALFTEELVAQTSEKLCGAIAQSASISAEQKVRFTLWRTLAEMREKMNPTQVLERIEGYSQPEFDAFVDYVCTVIRENPASDQVPPKVKSALTEGRIVAKWVGLLAVPNTSAFVSQLWSARVPNEPLLNELLNSHDIFHKALVMELYGKLSIIDQARVFGQFSNGEKEAFMVAHLQYLNQLFSTANGLGKQFDEKLLNTAVVRHVLDADYTLRAGVDNFRKLMRGNGESSAHFADFTPAFIMKLLELSVAISNCTNEERLRTYSGFKNLRKEFPGKLIATLSNEQMLLLNGITTSYVAAGRNGQRVASPHLNFLLGLLNDKMPHDRQRGVEYL